MANAFDQFDSTSESSNPFDQFDSTGQKPRSAIEKPKTFIADALIPSFLDTIKDVAPTTKMKGSGLMDAAADVALGVPEAIGAAAGGLGQFIGGVAVGAPSLAEALPQSSKESFSPARGARAALEAGEKAMKPFSYEPKTGTANLLLSPITVGFGTLNKSLEKIIRGYHGPEADPKLVEDRVKGGQYVLNAAILGLSMLKGAKTVKDIDPADIAKLDSIKEQIPELKNAKTEDVFDILRQESIASEMPTSTGKHLDIITALTERAKTSDRPSMYRNVINLINNYEGDFVADFNNPKVKIKGISNKKNSSIRKTIQEVLDKRAEEDAPLESGNTVLNKSTEQLPKSEEVIPNGQETSKETNGQGGKRLLNQPNVETPVPNTAGVTNQGWLNEGVPVDISKGAMIKTPEGVEGWIHNPEIVPFDKSRVASRKRVRKAGGPTTVELQQYPDVESVKRDWELGSEISRAKALEEVQFDIGGDGESGYELVKKASDSPFSAVQVGDTYYRVVKKPEVPMKAFEPPIPEVLPEGYADTFLDNLKDEEFTGQGGVKEKSSEPIFEGTRGPDKIVKAKKKAGVLTAEDLKAWREGHIAEINAKKADASLNKSTQESVPPITSQDLPIISDRFKTYDSPEAAKADGATGKLLQDPETGRWMEEPRFEDDIPELFQDSEVDSPYYPEKKMDSIDDFDRELEYDGGRNLWELMNNERGAVEIDPITVKDGLKRIGSMIAKAAEKGLPFPDYLDSLGITAASKAALLKFQTQVPEYEKQLAEFNKSQAEIHPVVKDILAPDSPIVFQKDKKNKRGEVWSTMPAITEVDAKNLLGASRKNVWGTQDITPTSRGGELVTHNIGILDRYLEATETKINAFRRFGSGMVNYYRQWRALKTGKEAEFNQYREKIKEMKDTLTPQELHDLGIAAYADMKGGREALQAMGISEIPLMTPKMMEAFQWMTKELRGVRNRINFVRERTGQRPMPKLLDVNGNENYLPFIRKMNVLREMGSLEALTSMSAAKIKGMNLEFNGIFNPHNLARNKVKVGIELNPFIAMEKYLNYAMEEIYTAPLAAKMKEMAKAKLPIPGTRRSVSMMQHNPALAQLMLKWSDEIMGVDRTSSIMGIENPHVRWALTHLTKNIVTATIGGLYSTFIKQPTSLIGVYANTNGASLIHGLTKYLIDTPDRLGGIKSDAYTRSNVLSIRRAELAWKEFLDDINFKDVKSVKDVVAKASFVPMEIMDGAMAEIAWNAGERYGRKVLKLGEKEATTYADDMVERTQGMGLRGAVSPIQASITTKWMTLLQTFGIADFNYVAQDILGIKNPDITKKQQVGRVFRYVIGGVIANQVYQAMGQTAPFPQPIEEFVKAKKDGSSDVKALYHGLMELTEKFPVWGGSAKYGSSLGGVVGEFGDTFPKAVKDFSNLLDWEGSTQKQKIRGALGLGKSIFYLNGIPFTNQAEKSIRAYVNGGSAYKVVMGIYVEAEKESGKLGKLKGLRGLDK